jgi:hypothetical protein
MNYFDRAAMNARVETAKYNNTRVNANYAEMAASSTVGTAYGIDGLTGAVRSAVADGSERFNSITNSSLMGITTPAYARGNSGNSGYGDGR